MNCWSSSLQTFAIPGSIFLSILAGFLYPFPLALFLVCLCSSLGASFCYLLSKLFGRHLLLKYFRERIIEWQRKVNTKRSTSSFNSSLSRYKHVLIIFFGSSSFFVSLRLYPIGLSIFVRPFLMFHWNRSSGEHSSVLHYHRSCLFKRAQLCINFHRHRMFSLGVRLFYLLFVQYSLYFPSISKRKFRIFLRNKIKTNNCPTDFSAGRSVCVRFLFIFFVFERKTLRK